MRDRWYRKGKKNPYDPQIGEAAKANAAVAQQSQEFNQRYFDEFVKPAMALLADDTARNSKQQTALFDINYDQAKTQAERYKTLGIPAQDAYIKKLDEFNEPEYGEKQATAALGDQRVAQANQQAQQARKFGGLGIDPTSPAALSAQSDMAVMNAASEAGAQTRARDAAKALGVQTAGEKANVLGGAFANTGSASGVASGTSSAGVQGTTGGAAAAPGGAANVNTGLGLAQKAYGANLDAYSSLGKASIESYQSPLASIGALAGQVGAGWASGGFKTSDRRVKKAAKRIAILAHDIGLWAFRYLWDADDAPLRYGYMADEVEPWFPAAVAVGPGGYKMVDYSKVAV